MISIQLNEIHLWGIKQHPKMCKCECNDIKYIGQYHLPVSLQLHQDRCTLFIFNELSCSKNHAFHAFATFLTSKLCTEHLSDVDSPLSLLNLSCHSLLPKKQRCYCKTSSFAKEHCDLERGEEAAVWKGTWPLALQLRPGSEQRATVVITERLIADRTFQQPVVNWMELRGRKLQIHSHDRCSADDLYFRVVRGHACHFA